ncbi:hypothetical protein HPB50_003818 [Hyalomma asiaticum]|uniref:Uncharacterized protein n=1 Tax=Hyalomma asiaticum TaxID=266040 RepID=A0ACB7T5V9_HYAAI|nr:hypothetical protein HPB50_003818 [Hyalomma asiaticum]
MQLGRGKEEAVVPGRARRPPGGVKRPRTSERPSNGGAHRFRSYYAEDAIPADDTTPGLVVFVVVLLQPRRRFDNRGHGGNHDDIHDSGAKAVDCLRTVLGAVGQSDASRSTRISFPPARALGVPPAAISAGCGCRRPTTTGTLGDDSKPQLDVLEIMSADVQEIHYQSVLGFEQPFVERASKYLLQRALREEVIGPLREAINAEIENPSPEPPTTTEDNTLA